ncbi:MAG: hypothetical protein AAFV80_02010 [Bacteroidota bacterium]
MEFIDFLKYGAIGIALVLAILSFRLLSKEQEKEKADKLILNSIRNYMIFALVITFLFGFLEFFKPGSTLPDNEAQTQLERLWKIKFGSEAADTTLSLKVDRIETFLRKPATPSQPDEPIDVAVVCKEYTDQVKVLQDQLAAAQRSEGGFYGSITKLRRELSKDPDGWTNLKFDRENKAGIFEALSNIFQKLDLDIAPDSAPEDVYKTWRTLKRQWWVNKEGDERDHLKNVYSSDIPELVRIYLNNFSG